jgi:hypothetical protein
VLVRSDSTELRNSKRKQPLLLREFEFGGREQMTGVKKMRASPEKHRKKGGVAPVLCPLAPSV